MSSENNTTQTKTPEEILLEEKMKATPSFDKNEGFSAVILNPVKIKECNNALMRRANTAKYNDKWVVTEHVKGAVYTLYTDGVTYAIADSNQWVVPSHTVDNKHKMPSLTAMFNRLFAAAKELYPEIEQLKIHSVLYSKDVDLSSNYKNINPRQVIWSMESGTADAEGLIAFTPIPFNRVVSFLEHNAFNSETGNEARALKKQFMPVPVLGIFDTLKEAMDYNFDNETSKLDGNQGAPIHSVIVRPYSAWLNFPALKKVQVKKGSALARLQARSMSAITTTVDKKLINKPEPLLIKRRSRVKTMYDMFTYENLVSAMKE